MNVNVASSAPDVERRQTESMCSRNLDMMSREAKEPNPTLFLKRFKMFNSPRYRGRRFPHPHTDSFNWYRFRRWCSDPWRQAAVAAKSFMSLLGSRTSV